MKKHYTILEYINFWTRQTCEEDKGGSFNLNLYIKYLQVKNNKI